MNLKTLHAPLPLAFVPLMGGVATLASGFGGSRIRFAPETGSGTGGETVVPEATPETKPEITPEPKATEPKEPTLSETEAKLLKDLMKHKDSAKTAKQQAEDAIKAREEIQSKIRDILGVEDLTELETKLAEVKKAEEDKLKAAGDFEALRDRIISENRKELEKLQGARNQEVGDLKKQVEAKDATIRRLLVSNSFAGSKYIAEELTVSGKHAERLFGEHFKTEEHDGEMVTVAYLNGKPLVDKDGKFLSFDAAIAEIVAADPDKDSLFKPKARQGAGSGAELRTAELPQKDTVKGVSRIERALAAQK